MDVKFELMKIDDLIVVVVVVLKFRFHDNDNDNDNTKDKQPKQSTTYRTINDIRLANDEEKVVDAK